MKFSKLQSAAIRGMILTDFPNQSFTAMDLQSAFYKNFGEPIDWHEFLNWLDKEETVFFTGTDHDGRSLYHLSFHPI